MHLLFLPALLVPQGGAPDGGAQPQPQSQPSGLESALSSPLIPLLLCGVVFWFILLRPESKARKARQAMLDALQKGDEVVTSGGIYGSVVQVHDQIVTLQVSEGVRLRVARSGIQSVVARETESEKPAAKK